MLQVNGLAFHKASTTNRFTRYLSISSQTRAPAKHPAQPSIPKYLFTAIVEKYDLSLKINGTYLRLWLYFDRKIVMHSLCDAEKCTWLVSCHIIHMSWVSFSDSDPTHHKIWSLSNSGWLTVLLISFGLLYRHIPKALMIVTAKKITKLWKTMIFAHILHDYLSVQNIILIYLVNVAAVFRCIEHHL